MKQAAISIVIKNLLKEVLDAEPAYVLTIGVVIQVDDAAATREVAMPLEEASLLGSICYSCWLWSRYNSHSCARYYCSY